MTQPLHHHDDLNYEEYVDGLRRSNEELLECFKDLRAKIKRGSILKNEKVYFTAEDFDRINAVIAKAEGTSLPAPLKTITVHVEGGLVQDVTGIPPGVEVRVEDRDKNGDTSHPSWDAKKECVVTVYGGDGV